MGCPVRAKSPIFGCTYHDGQAPAYKVGQLIWEQIRSEHATRADHDGGTFDLKDFHTRALRLGSMGLDTLREALA